MKKTTKKTIAIILALLLLPTSPLLAAPPFSDVSTDDWFHEYVQYAMENNLMRGTSGTTFSPHTQVTKAMAVQVVYNHAGNPETAWQRVFDDVAEAAWYSSAVTWAARLSIIPSGGSFEPDAVISRQDLVVILHNYAKTADLAFPQERENPSFNDDTDIADYARRAVYELYRATIISGRANGSLDPQGRLTRAELATMLSGFVKNAVPFYELSSS